LDTGNSLKDYVKIHSKYSAGIFLKKYLANKLLFLQKKLGKTAAFSRFQWLSRRCRLGKQGVILKE